MRIHGMRSTRYIQRDVGISVAIAVLLRAAGVSGRADKKKCIRGGVVEQHWTIVRVGSCFHGVLRSQMTMTD
ncbi:hypothetical protein D3C75_1339430 [compost metagenome]